jgi:two-component system, NarL family, invasion response regulator UvrY
VKVLVVDDHPIVRAGLRRLLADEPEVDIREAADGKAALGAFREHRPDVVILDLNLPGAGGIDVISRLKAADPGARVLILSMHDDLVHVARALQAGAAGYLVKDASPDDILLAIRRVAAGQTYLERAMAEKLAFAAIRTRPDPQRELSARDLGILRLLAEGRTLPQIAETIGIGYKTAANLCSRLKTKLGAASTADLIRIAIHARLSDRDADLSDRDRGLGGVD